MHTQMNYAGDGDQPHHHRQSYGTSTPATSRDDEMPFFENESFSTTEVGNRSTVLRRALGGVAVLLVFGMGVSMASSRQASVRSFLPSTESLKQQTGSSPHLVTGETPGLTLRAYNEYGEFDRKALYMYGLDMVVEPYRDTIIKVKGAAAGIAKPATLRPSSYYWLLFEADEHGLIDQTVKPVIDVEGGSTLTVNLNRPGSLYTLQVKERYADGTIASYAEVTVTCKYVRRELRSLTQEDRDAFFDTMQEFYTVSMEDGKQKYGEDFSNYEIPVAYHNAVRSLFCYHAGLQFLTAHTAFSIVMERSLQMINPKVSLASWDFMIDAAAFGSQWQNSEIFSDDMFGPSVTTSADQFQVRSGRFSNVSSIHDPDHNLIDSSISLNYNPYGYINAPYNYQDLPGLTRTSSYCGLTADMAFATSDDFVACFDTSGSFYWWERCMELKVHGNMHGLLGGAFNCNVDFKEFSEQNPQYSTGLLTFALEFITTNYWPDNTFIPEYNECDTSCSVGDDDCGCTCLIDAMTIDTDALYAIVESFMSNCERRYHGELYMSYDADAKYPWGFLTSDGDRMSEEDTVYLWRHLVKLACEPGAVGYMSGGASPLDPIFWVLHPMFEKALHILLLVPHYRDTYDFTWVDQTCHGSGYSDTQPFTEKALGMGESLEFLTNEQILAIIQPTNPNMPYLYDNFGSWGGSTDWNPCPECSAAVRHEEGL